MNLREAAIVGDASDLEAFCRSFGKNYVAVTRARRDAQCWSTAITRKRTDSRAGGGYGGSRRRFRRGVFGRDLQGVECERYRPVNM